MTVVPLKPNCVFTDAFGRERLCRGLKHGKLPAFRQHRLSYSTPALLSLVITQGTGAGSAQEGKAIVGLVPIFPLDFNPRARAQANFHRLGIDGHSLFSMAEGGSRA